MADSTATKPDDLPLGSLEDSFRVIMRRCSGPYLLYTQRVANFSFQDTAVAFADRDAEVKTRPDLYALHYEPLLLLLKLAEASNRGDRHTLGALARRNMTRGEAFYYSSGILYVFLLRTEGDDAAINAALAGVQLDAAGLALLSAISETFTYDHPRYSDGNLERLPASLASTIPARLSEVFTIKAKHATTEEGKLLGSANLALKRLCGGRVARTC